MDIVQIIKLVDKFMNIDSEFRDIVTRNISSRFYKELSEHNFSDEIELFYYIKFNYNKQ